MEFLWCLVVGDCPCSSLWLLSFCALPRCGIQNPTSLLEPLVPWWTLVGCAMARGMQLWTNPTGMQTDRHSGTGSATKLLSVLQCSCKHEKSRALDQGLWRECSLWSTAAWSASKSTSECPSGSGLTSALTSLPADTMDVLSIPDWTCSSYRLCSIRVQISFALFSFSKKNDLLCLSLQVPEM